MDKVVKDTATEKRKVVEEGIGLYSR